jgi:hypothetical protein
MIGRRALVVAAATYSAGAILANGLDKIVLQALGEQEGM